MLYIGPELPWLPRWLVEKIRVRDYVHFNELPPALGISKPGSHYMLKEEIVLSQSQQDCRKPITNFFTWAQCFMLYMIVIASRSPEKAQRLGSLHVQNCLPCQKIQVAILGSLRSELLLGVGRQTQGILGQS